MLYGGERVYFSQLPVWITKILRGYPIVISWVHRGEGWAHFSFLAQWKFLISESHNFWHSLRTLLGWIAFIICWILFAEVELLIGFSWKKNLVFRYKLNGIQCLIIKNKDEMKNTLDIPFCIWYHYLFWGPSPTRYSMTLSTALLSRGRIGLTNEGPGGWIAKRSQLE